MERKLISVFCCSYCNKVGRFAGPMSRHERSCKNNPVNLPRCYSCANFEKEIETRTVLEEVETPGGCYDKTHEFAMHRCKAKGVLLYNGVKLWDYTKEAFSYDHYEWQEMPTMDCVCPEYKKEGGER